MTRTRPSGPPDPGGLIGPRVRAEMSALEAQDAADRVDGTPMERRLRAIPPEVGRFLAILVMGCRARTIVEVGTSAGYSTLWLGAAARRVGGRVITFEIDPAKVAIARSTFERAGIEDIVDLRQMDGGAGLLGLRASADVVFIDSEKADYLRLLEPAVLALRPSGLLVADNLSSHADDLAAFRDAAIADPRLMAEVVPIGRGELLGVRIQAGWSGEAASGSSGEAADGLPPS